MVDVRTRRLIFADSVAYLERDCADSGTGAINRLAHCVAYDVTDNKITAMRCYGAIANLRHSCGSEQIRLTPAR